MLAVCGLALGFLWAGYALPAQAASRCLDTTTYVSSDTTTEQLFRQGSAYYRSQNYQAAVPYLTSAARRGHPRAQAMLAGLYGNGYGVPRDYQQAVYWNRLAAAQGHPDAMEWLGMAYEHGGGVPVNLSIADQYLDGAARCGIVGAQGELAMNYEFGQGVARNRQMAIYWLTQAAPHWGQAHWLLEWLSKPNTPQFQNIDQLSSYINGQVAGYYAAQLPKNTGPRPGTSGCYESKNPACASDPTSLVYRQNNEWKNQQ